MYNVETHENQIVKTEYLIHIRTIIFLLVVLIFASLFTVFFLRKSCDRKKRENCYRDQLAFNFRIAQNIPDGAVVFLGDSMIRGLCVAAVTPYGVNLGIGRDTTRGVLLRMRSYPMVAKAKSIVIAVGVNDLIQHHKNGISARYKQIIQAIPNRIPLVLSTILPVDERVIEKVSNKDIIRLNKELQTVCSVYSHCHLSDITEKIVDFSGNLDTQYHIGDGIHLNAEGYRIWSDELNAALLRNTAK